jgi:hypothetical protein
MIKDIEIILKCSETGVQKIVKIIHYPEFKNKWKRKSILYHFKTARLRISNLNFLLILLYFNKYLLKTRMILMLSIRE